MGNIFLSILGISVSIGLIAAVLILLAPLLNKRYAAKWKYLIWIFLALRLLVPFSGANGQYIMDRVSRLKNQTGSESEEKNSGNSTDVSTPYRRIVVELPAQIIVGGSTQTRITYQTNGMRSGILRSGKPHGNRLYKTCSGFTERAV